MLQKMLKRVKILSRNVTTMFQRTAEGYPLIKTEKIKKIKKFVGIGSPFDSRYNTPYPLRGFETSPRLAVVRGSVMLQYYIYYNGCGHSDSVHPLHLL